MSPTTSKRSFFSTRNLVCLAMLCAVAYMVMFLSKTIFGPIKVAGFLSFDLKDAVIAIGGFLFGPLSAFIVSVVVSLLEMVSVSETGPVGLLMNVLSTIAFVCPAAWIYRRRHRITGAVTGLIAGGVCMALIMLLWNYLITPLYQGVPREVISGMLLPVFLPFNLIKAMMNGALTMILYKPVVTALRKARLVPESPQSTTGRKPVSKISVAIIGILVLASSVLLGLVLAGLI